MVSSIFIYLVLQAIPKNFSPYKAETPYLLNKSTFSPFCSLWQVPFHFLLI